MNVANRISFCRIILIPIFMVLVLYYTPQKDYLRFFAAFVFILSVLSDWLDGYVARKKKETTKVGAFLDPVADKLLFNTAFVLLFIRKGLSAGFDIPVWIPIVVLSRDLVLVLGSLLIYLSQGSLEIRPRILGKCSTFFQTASIVFIILHIPFITPAVWYITGFFTIASGLDYVWKGSRLIGIHESRDIA
jgi:CDP-diacylglycerol--glycerol-3-phosphate 3-phosphatidyltransferase